METLYNLVLLILYFRNKVSCLDAKESTPYIIIQSYRLSSLASEESFTHSHENFEEPFNEDPIIENQFIDDPPIIPEKEHLQNETVIEKRESDIIYLNEDTQEDFT